MSLKNKICGNSMKIIHFWKFNYHKLLTNYLGLKFT